MTFLNPTMLIGMLAAAIPVIIHLLNLRKLRRVEFSSLIFLKKLEKSKIRKIKLKQLILLALRTLIIIFIVAAFSRPTIKNTNFGGAGAGNSAVVLILDNSYSMSLVGLKGSNFSRMKNIAVQILETLRPADEIYIVTTAGKQYGKFANLNSALKFINLIKPSAITSSAQKLFNNAFSLLAASPSVNKEVFVVSDFQKNIFEKKFNLSRKVKADIYLVGLPLPEVSNMSVENFTLENKILTIGKPLYFNVKIVNGNPGINTDNLVTVYLNGKKAAIKNTGEIKKSETVRISATLKKGGFSFAGVTIRNDAFKYDNDNYICFYTPPKIRLLILSLNENESRFVKYALKSNPANVVTFDEVNFNRFNSVNIEDYNAVFLIGFSERLNVERINSFLKNGGGVALFPSSAETLDLFNKTAKKFLLPAARGLIGGKGNNINAFAKVDFNSPLFYGLFQGNKNQFLESPDIYRYFKIMPGGKLKPIITLEDGSVFLGRAIGKKRKLIVSSVAPVLSWGTFPLKNYFAPLINRILFLLSANSREIKPVLPNEGFEINLARAAIPEITVVRPDGSADRVDLSGFKGNYFHYRKTDLTGVYKVFSEKKLIDWAAVNPDPQESVFKRTNYQKLLKELNNYGTVNIIKNTDNIKLELKRIKLGAEIGKYLILLALILFAVEMFLSKNSKKEISAIENYLK